MAKITGLPSETLAHIQQLSKEGQSVLEQQRNRIAFGLVARAFYLASPGATDFYVAGDAQAKGLISKLAREQKWTAQEARKAPSGRTTRLSLSSLPRANAVRRLTVVLGSQGSGSC